MPEPADDNKEERERRMLADEEERMRATETGRSSQLGGWPY